MDPMDYIDADAMYEERWQRDEIWDDFDSQVQCEEIWEDEEEGWDEE